MSDYEFSLPFPPSLNLWTRAYRGRNILTKKGRDYRKAVIEHMRSIGLIDEGLDCRLSVLIRLYGPTNAKRDIDNFIKSPLDALTHCNFWMDDSQIDELRVVRCEKVKGGRLDLVVEKL